MTSFDTEARAAQDKVKEIARELNEVYVEQGILSPHDILSIMEIELVTGRDEPSDVDRRQRNVLAKDRTEEEILDPAPLRDGDEINVSTFLGYGNVRKRASCMCGTSNTVAD